MADQKAAGGGPGLLGGLLSRLTGRGRDGGRGLEIMVNTDDLADIWAEYPGLDPGATAQDLPEGLLVLDAATLAAIASPLAAASQRLAGVIEPQIETLAAAWPESGSSEGWLVVGEALVAGIGLGCALPRLAPWRQPTAFAVDFRNPAWQEPQNRPPFCRLSYLPGSGRAGLAVLNSRAWPAADQLVAASRSHEFAQTFSSYEGRGSTLTSYGLAGPALVSSGICRRHGGAAVQPRLAVTVPTIGCGELKRIEKPWRALLEAGAAELDHLKPDLHQAATQACPGQEGQTAGLLDVAYFVLADLTYGLLRANGALGDQRSDAMARTLKVRALLVDKPHELWAWLCGHET